MIDWHSHILPGIDDGSKNLQESLEMINMLSLQGVDTVIATPHFDADDESVDRFLERREKAFKALSEALPPESPKILCGAEVQYYAGISRLPDLKKLCIEGTNLLLLEMTMSKWSEYTVRELTELASKSGLKIIIAHIERYMSYQSQETVYRLYDNGFLMQVNASFFIGLGSKRKAINMLRNGEIALLGSDCHNKTSRPPKMDKALEVIERKLGSDFLGDFSKYGYSVLNKFSN